MKKHKKGYYSFQVWGTPIGKERARKGRGHFYTPPKTKAYENLIKTTFLSLYRKLNDEHKKWKLTVCVVGQNIRADGDNILKSVADALQGLIYKNDRQVRDWHLWFNDVDAVKSIIIDVEEIK